MRTTNRYFSSGLFALVALILVITPARSAPVGGDNELGTASGFFTAEEASVSLI